jgi:hypothetical protein
MELHETIRIASLKIYMNESGAVSVKKQLGSGTAAL